MPVYIGDTEITAAYNGASAASAIYLGSDKVWPVITFPYTVINSDVTGAAIPPGATGAWIHLWGKGANGTRGASPQGDEEVDGWKAAAPPCHSAKA